MINQEGNGMTHEQQWQRVQDLIDSYLERDQKPPKQLIEEEERIIRAMLEEEKAKLLPWEGYTWRGK